MPHTFNSNPVYRLTIKNFDAESHYKIRQAAAYNGETLQQFITRAAKHYIANGSVPYAALQHPTLGPMSVVQWLHSEPAIQIITFLDSNGEAWSNADLIAYAQRHINDAITQEQQQQQQ